MSLSVANTETRPSLVMGRVVLTVNDLDATSEFYQRAVGLHLMASDGEVATLGAGGQVLLELRRDRRARRRSSQEAGLFHSAFLLPARADLGRWIRNAMESRIAITGLADHLVSEAVYLNDPEGNGVEIYADHPRETWQWSNGHVAMATEALDVEGLVAVASDRRWAGVPEGTVVGHVHLQVGALAPAETFYREQLGLDVTCFYPGAVFYAADGYHHHVATNIWNSRGADVRRYPSTGLAAFEICVTPDRFQATADAAESTPPATDRRHMLRDPWGTEIVVLRA